MFQMSVIGAPESSSMTARSSMIPSACSYQTMTSVPLVCREMETLSISWETWWSILGSVQMTSDESS